MSFFPTLKIKTLRADAVIPSYESDGAAGADLSAAIDVPIPLQPGERRLIPTGLSVEVPANMELQVRPRSGLAIKKGITVLNTPGTVDSDYRGEICVILINLSDEQFVVEPGMRIAQMVIAPVFRLNFEVVNELSDTERGAGGFGSTGV